MDDIKIFTKNKKEVKTLIQTIRISSQKIGMGLRIEKYVVLIMKKGKEKQQKELPNKESILRKKKITNTWEY